MEFAYQSEKILLYIHEQTHFLRGLDSQEGDVIEWDCVCYVNSGFS